MTLPHLFRQLRASYSARLIAIFIAALSLMAAILNFTFIRQQQGTFATHMHNSGLALSRLLAESIQVDVFTENREQIAISVEALVSQENIHSVEIFSSIGEVLLSRSSSADQPLADCPSHPTEMATTPLVHEWPDCFFFWYPVPALVEYQDEDFLYFAETAVSAELETPPLGYVSLIMSKHQYQQDIQHIFIKTGLTILLLLTLLITGTLLIFRRMTLPLKELIGRIKKERQIGEVHDDIGLLDTTVTSLVADLDHAFNTINELTSGLEDKVAERTSQLAQANHELTCRREYLEEANRKLEKAMQELREAERQLIQSEKMAALGQVVAGVAHEINNNINFISGAMPSLGRGLADIQQLTNKMAEALGQKSGQVHQHLRQEALALKKEVDEDNLFTSLDKLMANIGEGVHRTTRIVADLRTYSRPDNEAFSRIDLHQAIDSTLTFLNKKQLNNIRIEKSYGMLPMVACRADRLNQVFLNIMNNGVQAMAEQGGTLGITTFVEGDQVHIRFSDTGVGISPQVLPRIFDPFYTNKAPGQGTGIGLAISDKIIQEHQGQITVQSRLGEGSTFEIILPISRQEDETGDPPLPEPVRQSEKTSTAPTPLGTGEDAGSLPDGVVNLNSPLK